MKYMLKENNISMHSAPLVLSNYLKAYMEEDRELLWNTIRIFEVSLRRRPFVPPHVMKTASYEWNEKTEVDTYPHYKQIRYHWPYAVDIAGCVLPQRAKVILHFTNKTDVIFYSKEDAGVSKKEFAPIRGDCAVAEVFSNFPLVNVEKDIFFLSQDYCQGQEIYASSSWLDTNGLPSPFHLPSKAVDGDEKTFWNSDKDWTCGDHLTVLFQKPRTINLLYIRERMGVQRICEFSVQVKPLSGEPIEIHHHIGLIPEDGFFFHFAPQEATSIRIVFIKCNVDPSFGYSEPGITHLKAYYNKND